MSLIEKKEQAFQSVVFKLGNDLYCMDIFRVNEIIRLREITPIPRSSAHVKGLINLRGKTIPVVDLKVRMNLDPSCELDDNSRIIVVDTPHGSVGIIVDAVKEVATIYPENIDTSSLLLSDDSSQHLLGVTRKNENVISILNLDKALSAV